MQQEPSRIAPGASTDERASSSHPPSFEPVPVQYRHDGWTPARQREYVEALADSGVAKWAAERVGMTVQSANRLRRRADARSFDAACEAAERIGGRNTLSRICEIALEGRVKQHFYKGELVGEERIHDTRLLIALLPRLAPSAAPSPHSRAAEASWQPWLDAIERGEDPAANAEAARREPTEAAGPYAGFDGSECWEDDDGCWWTGFPPPEGFQGAEQGRWGSDDYQRTLSPEEEAVILADLAHLHSEDLAAARAARDRYFGFVPEGERLEVKGSRGPLPSGTGPETSEPSPARPAGVRDHRPGRRRDDRPRSPAVGADHLSTSPMRRRPCLRPIGSQADPFPPLRALPR